MKVNNFIVLESEYGKFIVNRYCAFQAESLVKTGRPHIQNELNNILALVEQLPENCVIVDAGANIGLISLPIAKAILSRGGTVHAFEVQRMMFYALCGTAALNDLENLIVHNQALGSANGTLGAAKPDYSQPQDFGLFSLTDQSAALPERVEMTTVDSLGLSRLDFIKIDVEGMEVEVLKGARDSIRRYLPWGWVEYWKSDVNKIKAQFAGLDYKFYLMDELNMLCVPTTRLARTQLTVRAPEA
jgi:FkbM family methyltransferase